jgi:methenyltetrahydrofolate cyclohydrolase
MTLKFFTIWTLLPLDMAAEPQLIPALATPSGGSSLAEVVGAFAAVSGVPGSGSANAVTAAIAAALVSSVAAKTVEHAGEPRYRPVSNDAKKAVDRGKHLSNELLILADEDAKAFAPIIALRRKAKSLRERYDLDQAVRKEIAATKPATEIPLKIAQLAFEVADHAAVMLQHGFSAARGESFSALLAALASAEGALYVARMNIMAVSRKITTLDDPGYERPWLKLILRRTEELEARLLGYRDRVAAIREKERAESQKALRTPKRRPKSAS